MPLRIFPIADGHDEPLHICVIGAGLAGGILASKLARRGYRVTLIEQGDKPAPSRPDDEDWESGFARPTFSRGQGIGGTSNYWHAGLMALDRSDVEGCATGETPNYPISYADLCTYYKAALKLLTNNAVSLRDALSNALPGGNVRVDSDVFRLKQLFFPPAPFSTSALIEAATREHRLKVITGFRVDRLVFAGPSDAGYVEGSYDGQRHPSRLGADAFVLCAGGIGSPKILLKSAIDNPMLRVLPIGESLTDHPTGFVFKAKLRRRFDLGEFFEQAHDRRFRKRWGFVLKDENVRLASTRNHVVYLRPALSLRNPVEFDALKRRIRSRRSESPIRDMLRLLGFGDLMLEAVGLRFGLFRKVRYVSGFVFADQLPSAENRITLGDDGRFKIRWSVTAADRGSLREFLEAFVRRHEHLFETVEFFSEPLVSGAHHSGACRMAALPTDGVVDENLRVFGMNNVYVADGSVLPYSGHANTGLTIAALALKCADAFRAHGLCVVPGATRTEAHNGTSQSRSRSSAHTRTMAVDR